MEEGQFLLAVLKQEVKMPDIIEVNDTDAVVRSKIIAILEFDGISTDDITSWGIATNRLNLAANRLGLQIIENNMGGAEARARINALALSPAPVYPENTVLPTVSGTPQYNQTLTATTGTWNGYPAVEYSYQWQADEIPIPGATSSTYLIKESDLGKQIRVGVTATNQSGPASVFSAPTATVTSAPINSTLPTISGTAANGQTLTTNNGSWIAFPAPTFTYQWKADGTNIAGATNQTLVLGNNQIGREITVDVTATNSQGSDTKLTAATARVTSAPINTVLPVFAAEAVEGKSISTTNGTWLGYPAPTYTYQWKRNGANISGATNQSYTVAAADVGQNITVTVTATNSINAVSATSAAKMAKPTWAETFDAWRNFATNVGDLPNPEDIHPSVIQAPNSAGVYSPFAANELVRTDLGLQNVPTRGNFAINFAPYRGGIHRGNVSRGSTVATADPFGGNEAARFTLSGASDPLYTMDASVGTALGNRTFTFSIWLRLEDAMGMIPTAVLYLYGSTGVEQVKNKTVTLTNQWKRFEITGTFASATSTGLTLRVDPFDGSANQNNAPVANAQIDIFGFQIEEGSFSTPPIITAGTSLTVTGNRQSVLGLSSQLTNGVSGFVQFDLRQPTENARRIIWFTDGTANNRVGVGFDSDNQIRTYSIVGGTIVSGGATAGPLGSGPLITVAFVLTGTYRIARAVGGSVNSPNTQAGWPLGLDRFSIASEGYTSSNSTYQFTRKISIDYLQSGEDPATTFANVYAKAQLAHAAP